MLTTIGNGDWDLTEQMVLNEIKYHKRAFFTGRRVDKSTLSGIVKSTFEISGNYIFKCNITPRGINVISTYAL